MLLLLFAANSNDSHHHIPNTKMALFVDHPEQVMRMIREAKDKVAQQQVIPGIAVDPNPNPSPKPNA